MIGLLEAGFINGGTIIAAVVVIILLIILFTVIPIRLWMVASLSGVKISWGSLLPCGSEG